VLSKDDFDPDMDGRRGDNYRVWREGIYVYEDWNVRSDSGRALGSVHVKQVWLPMTMTPFLVRLDLFRADDDFDPT
jgi:hypothetical protein